jgi:hypothetical protein
MEVLFQAGIVLAFSSDIRTKLFPKVFLNPNGLRLQEHEQLIGRRESIAKFSNIE